jgi:GNAT superfamily N-acetyltransferase
MITVTPAETPEDLDAVRNLVRYFVRWAMAEIAKDNNPAVFEGLETELAGLPGRYSPPGGGLILARMSGEPVGCVAFFDRGAMTMEVKRMFVTPTARGHGIGGKMLERLLSEAGAAGHHRALLWTHRTMEAAQAIYRKAGFHEVPLSDEFVGAAAGIDVCMEMDLRKEPMA